MRSAEAHGKLIFQLTDLFRPMKHELEPSKSGSGLSDCALETAIKKTVHQLFVEQSVATPDAIAVVTDKLSLTYRELNESANRLAGQLQKLGVGRGTFVGVCLERGPEVIIALLAILKVGGAYVPLDPTYPDERLAFMLRDTAAPVTLAHGATTNRMTPILANSRIVSIDHKTTALKSPLNDDISATVSNDDPAYVMYTSGSTGRPKGVVVPHRGIVRLVRDTDYCDFDSSQVFLHHSPLAFDASTFEIWGPLLNGGRLALLQPGLPTLDSIDAAIRRHGVTTLWLTAGLFHLLVDQRVKILAPLRQLLAGGDVLSPQHVRRALAVMENGVVINGYGPTESTTFACCHRMQKGNAPTATVPIGRPIANTSVCILNDEMKPAPVGAPGELFIGGAGVALCYLNQPELTLEKFILDPIYPGTGARLYKTGDKVRQLADGTLEFLGRFDDQVKINGHRIEPGEIAATLDQLPGVRQCAVVARDNGQKEKQLVAYVVVHHGLSVHECRRQLANRLPAHLVPAHIVLLDSLPLTPNGKINRSALPPPGHSSLSPAKPTNRLEAQIADICQRILRRPIGLDDNFFDIGATSLNLIEIHAEITKSFDGELSITEVFACPTVKALSSRLEKRNEPVAVPVEIKHRARQQKEALARRRHAVGGRS